MAHAQNYAYSIAFIRMHLIEVYSSRSKKVLSVTANQIVFSGICEKFSAVVLVLDTIIFDGSSAIYLYIN